MDNNERGTAILACFVHGALAFGHILGALYNMQRNNRKTTVFHLSAAVFDCWATYEHEKERRKCEKIK